jgi:CRISPR-associated endonuclease Csy4
VTWFKKRALARGEVSDPQKLSISRDYFHRVAMSSSTQEEYILLIQKEKVDCKAEPIFSSYGFSSNVKFNGTVADLSTLTSSD